MTESTQIMVPEIVNEAIAKEQIQEGAKQSLVQTFAPYHEQIAKALEVSRTVTNGESVAMQRVARSCRLELRKIRCDIENARKRTKDDALRYGKAVDGLANVLKFLCEPEEKRLEDIERYAERKEAERIAQLVADRSAALIAVDGNPDAYNLASMDEETFTATVETARRIRDERIEAARRLEAERVAREKAETEERERVRQENIKLRAEAEAREKAAAKERAEAEAERRRVEAERAKERAELEAKALAEAEAREKAERAMRKAREREQAAETARRLEADRKAKAEAEAAELARRKEADAKHRNTVMTAAVKSLEALGHDSETATLVIRAIANGQVERVKIEW